MASKTISVTESVYNLLKSLKLPHESFGDIIKRLCEEKIGLNLLEWINHNELWSKMDPSEYSELNKSLSSAKYTLKEIKYE